MTQAPLVKTLIVRVTPSAKLNKVVVLKTEEAELHLKVYTTAPQEKGKANQAVLKLLAAYLGVGVSSLVLYGTKSRHKVVNIVNNSI